MLIRLKESYLVASGDVYLEVVVGQGQKGYVEVLLGGAFVTDGKEIRKHNLGKGTNLAGRKLRVTTTVADTNPNTNLTTVTYTLSGGKVNKTWESRHTVSAPGGSADYDAIFLLI